MAGRSAIGLDIGTSGVRAAELSFSKGLVTLEKFGQVALPEGAVRDGEVIDPDAVAAAIKQLWAHTKFSSKKVIIGVANQKVIVRQVDLPWMPADELKASLAYQVQDTSFFQGVIWVVLWFVIAIAYFALVGRHKLILSPEEEFAMAHRAA